MNSWKEKTRKIVNNETIFEKLKKYVDLIITKNKEFNLTGFDEIEIWRQGIYQSISLLNVYIKEKNVSLLDIGAGAGFPSIPFFIFKECQINLTIYEPLKKRFDFLNYIVKELNLTNIKIFQQKIENSNSKNEFDYITARAVTSLDNLIKISYNCGKNGSKYIFLKSKSVQDELNKANKTIKSLGIINFKIERINIEDGKEHNIVYYVKQN